MSRTSRFLRHLRPAQRVALAVAVLVGVVVVATSVDRTLWWHDVDAEVVDVRRSSVGWGNTYIHTLTVTSGSARLVDRHLAAALQPGAEVRTERWSTTVVVDGLGTNTWASGELWRGFVAAPLAVGCVVAGILTSRRRPKVRQ